MSARRLSLRFSDRNARLFATASVVAPSGRTTWRTLIDGNPLAPVRRRVWLFRFRDGAKLAEAWSDATTGEVTFRGLPMDEMYVAAAWDHTGNYEYLAGGPMPAVLEA